jgi:multiple sugar transport system substrate-binding protein
MLVGPAHIGKFRLIDAYGWAPGDVGVAAPLRWADEDETYNYSSGVSYAVSRHSAYQQAATDVIEWIATGPYQTADDTVTLPAYQPAQENWIAANESNFTVADGTLKDVFDVAQDTISNYWFEMPVESVRASWDQIVMPGLAQGKTVAEMLPAWQQYIVDEGGAAGWTVETER